MQTEQILERLAAATGVAPKKSNGGWMLACPAHADKNPSLSVSIGADGRTLVRCFAGCSTDDILSAVGLTLTDLFADDKRPANTKPDLTAVYPYTDEDGDLLFEVCRFVPKDFRQRRPDGEGGFLWDLKGVRRVLYRLPDVVEAVALERPVILVEGEKDADNVVAKLGLAATTVPGGAGKWRPEYADTLRGAHVVIVPDNDKPGRDGAATIAQALTGVAASVKVLELPGLPPKGDISDWLDLGGTRAELDSRIKKCPLWTPAPVVVEQKPEDPLLLCSDHGVARELARRIGEDIRHHSGLGWLCWDGTRWRRDEKTAKRRVHDYGEVFRKLAADLIANKNISVSQAKAATMPYLLAAGKCESDTGADHILNVLRVCAPINADDIHFDAHPYLLNCPNGVVDLENNVLLPHRRDLNLTKLSATPYELAARTPVRWLRFLEQVFACDYDLIGYVQRALGYSLSGRTHWQCFFVCHGSGANGKSTFISAIQKIIGPDFAQQVDPEELMIQKHARHSTELAALHGARFVTAVETTAGRRLNESLIKGLTGGDRIRARFMRCDSFEFTPELKLWIGTNHRPTIRDESHAMWRRVRMIPFEQTFQGRDADTGLLDALLREREGILGWVVEGALQATVEGPLPRAVQAANAAYKADEDTLKAFLTECCDFHPFAKVSRAELFASYREFMQGRCETQAAFTKRLSERAAEIGVGETKAGGERLWTGIGLLTKTGGAQ